MSSPWRPARRRSRHPWNWHREDWRLGKGYKLTGRANFAFESNRGNTDTDELEFDADLTYRRLKDRFVAFAELERDRDNERKKDVTTADNWKLSTRYHRFITKKWFYGGVLAADADDKADRELRLVAGPLVGYQFFESRPMNFRTELAITRVHEEFKNESDNNYTAAGWGINFDKYLFDEFMQFYHRQNGLMSFDDYSDIVWDTWTGLRFPLVYGFVASTEVQTEYDGGAAKEADDLDTTYLLKLGYAW
jgi:putative salt-induced outer membrane protein YdiY